MYATILVSTLTSYVKFIYAGNSYLLTTVTRFSPKVFNTAATLFYNIFTVSNKPFGHRNFKNRHFILVNKNAVYNANRRYAYVSVTNDI